MTKVLDKVALVTGASRGIGRATTVLLAKSGARVVGTARSEEDLNSLRREIESDGGVVTTVPGDASSPSDVERVVAATMKTYGRIDILVNNAGIGILGPLVETRSKSLIGRSRQTSVAFSCIRGKRFHT